VKRSDGQSNEIESLFTEDSQDSGQEGRGRSFPVQLTRKSSISSESISASLSSLSSGRSRQSKRFNLKDLNDDCLILVFDLFNFEELRKCQQVCRQWNRLIARTLIRRLRYGRLYARQMNGTINFEKTFTSLDLFVTHHPNQLLSMLKMAAQTRHLKIQIASSRYLFRFHHLHSQRELRFLCLEVHSDKCLSAVNVLHKRPYQSWCPQLTTLLIKCERYQWLDRDYNLLRLLSCFPRLTTVKVRSLRSLAQTSARTTWTPPQPLHSLHTLSLRSCKFLVEQDLSIFDHLPSLRTLSVGHVYWELLFRMMTALSSGLESLRLTRLHCPNWRHFSFFLLSVCQLERVQEIRMISTKLFVGPWLRTMLSRVFDSCESLYTLQLNGFEVSRSNPRGFERFVRFTKRKGDVVTNAVNAFKTTDRASSSTHQQEHLWPILKRTQSLRISASLNLLKLRALLPEHFNQLRSLSVTFDVATIDDLLLDLMNKPIRKLMRLELRHTNRVTDKSLSQLPSGFPRLQYFCLSLTQMSLGVGDKTWKGLIQLRELRELHLRRLHVQPSSFLCLIRNSPSLYVVECSDCRGINQSTVRSCINQKLALNPLLSGSSLHTSSTASNPFSTQ
jgi:hypothetical protein